MGSNIGLSSSPSFLLPCPRCGSRMIAAEVKAFPGGQTANHQTRSRTSFIAVLGAV
jgi:hypothetical protein